MLEVSELTMQPLVGPGERRREATTPPEARPFLAAAAKFTIYAFNDIGRRASRRRESPLYQMNVGGKGGERKSKMRVSYSPLLEMAKTAARTPLDR